MNMHVHILGERPNLFEHPPKISRSMWSWAFDVKYSITAKWISNRAHSFVQDLEPVLSSMQVVIRSMPMLTQLMTQHPAAEIVPSVAVQAQATQYMHSSGSSKLCHNS